MNKKKLTIAVTGSSGFIGKKLCQSLIKKGFNVLKYDSKNFSLAGKIKLPGGIDVLYHLAALNKPYLSRAKPLKTFRVNVLGTMNLLEAARIAGVKKIIFASSILVYKNLTKTNETDFVGYNGIHPYSLEKIISEEYIKIYSDLFGIDYAILRISGVYGPEMIKNPIYDIIQGFLKGKVSLYVNKNSIYNFVYIDDVISAMLKALNWGKKIINVCCDENLKIKDIYNLLSMKTGKMPEIKDNDFLIKILGSNKKIKKMGWKQGYSFKKGLQKTYNYFKK